MPDPSRRPAIAGAAQFVQRIDDPREAKNPVEMMETALRDAAEDAGAPKLLESLDAILVPRGTWKYGDPGRLIGARVGSPGARTATGAVSGHIAQVLVDHAHREIAAGRLDVVAIVGGESENSKRRLAKQDLPLHWDDQVPGDPDERFGFGQWGKRGEPTPPVWRSEIDAGVMKPTMCFSLCDTSLRSERGETPSEHRRRISELWARMSAIGAENPSAWIQQARSAEEIREPTPANRMVSYPYTKLMTSNISVDQSAALILCSAEAATRFGIDPDRLVHLRAATEMNHVTPLSTRTRLHRHEGMEIAGQRVLELAGIEAGDLDRVDLYSCFPLAVQAGARAVGLDEAQPLSVTGGLTFSGGPFGNYVLQAKARMVELLREDPGSLGLIGSVGGNFAKFAFGVYSTEPGDPVLPTIEDVSKGYEAIPEHPWSADYAGLARVEAYSVDMLPEGPLQAAFSVIADSGERVFARCLDRPTMEALVADEDACGREARVADGLVELV